MKKLIFALLFVITLCYVSATECGSIPSDYCIITQNTLFEKGDYNLIYGISIAADNIELDCNGANIYGDQNFNGIGLSGRTNVTIKNCILSNFWSAIRFDDSHNNVIYNNNISHCQEQSITLFHSDGNIISSNDIFRSSEGIGIVGSYNNVIIYNNLHDNNNQAIGVDRNTNTTIEYNNIIQRDMSDSEPGYVCPYAYIPAEGLTVNSNWFGTSSCETLNAERSGSANFEPFLDSPYPGGKSMYCSSDTGVPEFNNLSLFALIGIIGLFLFIERR
jgi:parallel beta-helix repeat protein